MKQPISFLFAAILSVCIAAAATGCSTTPSTSEQRTKDDFSANANGTEEHITNDNSSSKAVSDSVSIQSIQKSRYKMSLTHAKMYDEVVSSKYYTNKPKDGKKYLGLFFTVENVSNKEQFMDGYYFSAFEDGNKTHIPNFFGNIERYSFFSGETVAPGQQIKGFMVYEVDPNWKEFRLTYHYTGYGIDIDEDTYDFLLTPQDLS